MSTLEAVPDVHQLRFDGMPVAQHKIVITGTVTVSEEAAKGWKLGDAVTVSVTGVVSSRKHKAQTNFGEPTGDVEHQIVIHVHDIDLDGE